MTTWLKLLLLCTSVTLMGAVLPLAGDFRTLGKDGMPEGWRKNAWRGYAPFPQVTMTTERQQSVMHIAKAQGKYGFGIVSTNVFPARSGDVIRISANLKGTGTAAFHLQYFGDRNWCGADQNKAFAALTPQWERQTFELTVRNLAQEPTKRAFITFSGTKDTELYITDIKATITPSNAVGDLTFPTRWRMFGPIPKDFQPTPQELTGNIPQKLAGNIGKDTILFGGTLDFAQAFGKHAPHLCGWAFAELNAPYDCQYTIAAGADWWMQVFLNGKPIIDTMATGNIKHPPKLDDHRTIANVKKGTNLLAVKIISGGASSIMALGGAEELRAIVQRLNTQTLFFQDDFDQPRQRPGNPTIIQGYPTRGLYTLTGQGVYTASPTVTLADFSQRYPIPKGSSNQFLTMGLRVQSFNTQKGHAKLVFDGGPRAQATVTYRTDSKSMRISMSDRNKIVRQLDYPREKLPADITFARKQNLTALYLKSLVDSSLTVLQYPYEQDYSDETMAIRLHAEKQTAEITVDELFLAQAVPENKQNIPFRIDQDETFDPRQKGWNMVWNDEFNGTEIDWKNKWYVPQWSADRTKDYARLDGKGFLHIVNGRDPKTQKIFTSMLWSKQSFLYGFFEARVKFTRKTGWNAAFWCINAGNNPMTGGGYEIDIFEDYTTRPRHGGPPQPVLDHNLHAYMGRDLLKSYNHNARLPGTLDDFYVIGAKWTPFEVSYYINGKLIRSNIRKPVSFNAIDQALCVAPVQAILSAVVRQKDGPPIDEEYLVDYIRIWQEPQDLKPTAIWMDIPTPRIVRKEDTITLGATATPSPKTNQKITGAYLFDNGYLIDYKTKPPFIFKFAINERHYGTTPYMKPGRQRKQPKLDGYAHFFTIAVQDIEGKVATTPVKPIILKHGDSTPHKGLKAPWQAPGSLRAKDFDDGGTDIAHYLRKDQRLDRGITLYNGDWLAYSVDVTRPGTYDLHLTLRAGTNEEPPSVLNLFLDDQFLCTVPLDPNRKTATIPTCKLAAGRHILTVLHQGSATSRLQDLTWSAFVP